MTIFTFANNVNTTLAGSVSSGATSLTLSSTKGLPASIPAGTVLAITLSDQATRQNFEVIYATAVSGATLSGLARGQEGTAALSWLTGDLAYSGPTAGQQGSFGQAAAANTWTGQNTFVDPVVIAPAVNTNEAINGDNFPSSLNPIFGYKQYPDPNSPTGYVIEQWLTVTINATAGNQIGAHYSLPTPWPTAYLSSMIQFSGNTPPTSTASLSSEVGNSLSNITAVVYSAVTTSYLITIWAKGY
jgi:hypothetical protein